MAVFTTTTRTPLKWQAPELEIAEGEAYELLISDDYKLDVGSGFNLTIKPEVTAIQYDTVVKSQGSNNWPQPEQGTTLYELNIGDGFSLNIGDGYNLIINSVGRNEVSWSTVSRTPLVF